jgi:ATP-dependent Lon protease
VVAPALNEPDIDDIPEHLRKKIEFIFVDTLPKALAETLEESPSRNGRPARKSATSAGARSRKKPAASRR